MRTKLSHQKGTTQSSHSPSQTSNSVEAQTSDSVARCGLTRTPCRSTLPAAPVLASDTPMPDLNFRTPDLPPSARFSWSTLSCTLDTQQIVWLVKSCRHQQHMDCKQLRCPSDIEQRLAEAMRQTEARHGRTRSLHPAHALIQSGSTSCCQTSTAGKAVSCVGTLRKLGSRGGPPRALTWPPAWAP